MKKTSIFLVLMVGMAMGVIAQAPLTSLMTIDTNQVTNHSATIGIFSLSTPWKVKIQAMESGTGVWLDSYIDSSTNPIIYIVMDSLVADADYTFRAMGYDMAMTDSAVSVNTQTAHTKPNVQPVSILFLDTIATLQPGLTFSASSVGGTGYGFGLDAQDYITPVTDTVFFTGNVIDTVRFLSSSPGQMNPAVQLVIRSTSGGGANLSPIISPPFRTPGYTKPDIAIPTHFNNRDSISAPIVIASLGNFGPVNLYAAMRDRISGTIVAQINPTVTTVQTIPLAKGGLSTNRWYDINATGINGAGLSDTVSLSVKTDQVNAPTGTAMGTPVGYSSYTPSAFADPQGSYDSSEIVKGYLYENAMLVDSQNLAMTAAGTISFPARPAIAGASYTDQVKLVNLAGLSYTISFSVSMPVAPIDDPPTFTSITDIDPSQVRLEGIVANVKPGNSATIFDEVQNMSTGIRERFIVASAVTTVGPQPNLTVGNREGNTHYCHTLIDSANGRLVYGTQKCSTTIAPTTIQLYDIVKTSSAADKLAVEFRGNCGGYNCELQDWLYLNNAQVAASIPIAVGTGQVSYPESWDNLYPNTEYKAKGNLAEPNGNHLSSHEQYFWTETETGISKVPENAKHQLVRAYNLLGQELGSQNEYLILLKSLQGTPGIITFVPVNREGRWIGSPRKVTIVD